MGITYRPHSQDTYRARFVRTYCYVRKLQVGVWVSDTNPEELDDDLEPYKTRKAAATACLLRQMTNQPNS